MEEPSEYVDFMVKYKDWLSIKRLGIRPDTKPEEIVSHLAGIRGTIDSKVYALLGIDTAKIDSFVESITAGKRKGYASLSEVFGSLLKSGSDNVLGEACGGKPLKPIAEAYMISRIVKNLGFETGVDQLALSKIYPELKPPKALGRFGKGKKAPPQPSL
ncbi:MAG: DUF2666 family protein [Candidatus Micrarchaeaceae archaeon]